MLVTHHRPVSRFLNILAAIVLGGIGVVAAAAPAQAGPTPYPGALIRSGEVVCIETLENGVLVQRCLYLSELVFLPPELDPPQCLYCAGLALESPVEMPLDRQREVLDAIGLGFGLLTEAYLSTAPELAVELRAEAMYHFRNAAELAATDPDGDPAQPVPGYLNVDTGAFEPGTVPGMADAGPALIEALIHLASGDPERMTEAEALLDLAHQQLTAAHYR